MSGHHEEETNLTVMDLFSILTGVCGLISGVSAMLYAVFSIEAAVDLNTVHIDLIRQEGVRIEQKHDQDNSKIVDGLEKLDRKIDDRNDKIDVKLDKITDHLIRQSEN